MKKDQSGNVLFIILIAVALFGALSFAVTQNNRSSTTLLSQEQAKNHINQIDAYAATITRAFNRLRTIKGCKIDEISFEHANYFGGYDNSRAPADERCHIFSSAGGQITFKAPPADARVSASLENTAHWNRDFVYVFGDNEAILDVGSSASEVLLQVSFVKDEVCAEINRQEGISAATRTGVDFSGYSGSLTVVSETYGDTSTDADLASRMRGCVIETASGTAGNHLFIVIATQ